MGKKWKKILLARKLEAAKAAKEVKVVAPEPPPAPKPEPVPAPVIEKVAEKVAVKKVEEKPKPKRSYKAKKNSTAKKKVKK